MSGSSFVPIDPNTAGFFYITFCLFLLFSPTVKDMYDYQGRSYLHVPQDVGINLRSADAPDKCYLPKKQIHVWSGHTKVSLRRGKKVLKVFVLMILRAVKHGHLCIHISLSNPCKMSEKIHKTL